MCDSIRWKFRTAKMAFMFTAEALAIGQIRDIIEKKILGAILHESTVSGNMLRGISNISTINSISHISRILRQKTEIAVLDPRALWS
jgi:hypothetical protein